MHLTSYGMVFTDFKHIAKYRKILEKIQNGELEQTRVDCYPLEMSDEIRGKFSSSCLALPTEIEIFCPSDNYPSHVDEGDISYFIALESGTFTIGGVDYIITPFVLYRFFDGLLHNSDFCSIMLK